MAAETARLPTVDCVRVSKRGSAVKEGEELKQNEAAKREEEVAAFLASVRLGSLERHPRPGDVFRKSRFAPHNHQRPLGLVPDRGTSANAYYFLPPIFPSAGLTADVEPRGDRVPLNFENSGGNSAFRHPGAAKSSRHVPSAVSYARTEDGEYADTLAKCKMEDYTVPQSMANVEKSVAASLINRHRPAKTVAESGTKLLRYVDAR